MLNRRKQGDKGVAAAIYYYTAIEDAIVSLPMTEASRYDLVVDRGKGLERIQCKTSSSMKPSGNFEVQLQTKGGNRSWEGTCKSLSSEECDILFVWCSDRSMWEFPIEAVEGRTTLTTCEKYFQYKVMEG